MFQTTRFLRSMLKGRPLLSFALLAFAGLGAPDLSAQICCFVPNSPTHHQQSAPTRGASSYRFKINGGIYWVDDNLFVWGQSPYGPVGHIVAAGNGRYIADMYSGGRYWAYLVQ